jgi:hypothetical protein
MEFEMVFWKEHNMMGLWMEPQMEFWTLQWMGLRIEQKMEFWTEQ